MPFTPNFEKHVNTEMLHHQEAGPSFPDIKGKGKQPETPQEEVDIDDAEYSEKRDRPPRFSTLFGVAPPLPSRQIESCPQPQRKSGIWLPTPLFIVFAVILLFESTILFAYLVIGLYNTMPARLVPSGCNCEADKPAINIAPNFVLPQGRITVTETIAIISSDSRLPKTATSSTSISTTLSTTSTSSASSTSLINTTSRLAGVASDLMGILGGNSPATTTKPAASSIVYVTETPTRSTVNSIVLLTVNPEGSTLAPRPTITSTSFVDGAAATTIGSIAQRSISVTPGEPSAISAPGASSSDTSSATETASTDPASTETPGPSSVSSSSAGDQA